jgi:hypothetical protein
MEQHGSVASGGAVTGITRGYRRKVRRRARCGTVLLAACLVAVAASEARSAACFSAPEIEADQALRYVTRLMVVGDACRSPAYSKFLERNGETVSRYRDEMVRHFQRSGDGGAGFDRYVTALANDEGRAIGGQSAAALCTAAESDMLAAADLLGPGDLRRLARARAAAQQAAYRRCRG